MLGCSSCVCSSEEIAAIFSSCSSLTCCAAAALQGEDGVGVGGLGDAGAADTVEPGGERARPASCALARAMTAACLIAADQP